MRKSRSRRRAQLALLLPTHGGKRKGAGRKPNGERAGVSHLSRPDFPERLPIHVTLRVLPHVYNLRSKRSFRAITRAFARGRERFGFRLIHYSVQGNHLHLLCEATGKRALSRGIQGLTIRLGKALNRVMEKSGKVFSDRYHARILKTPTETRHALAYLRNNLRHHGAQYGKRYPEDFVDEYCSVPPLSRMPLDTEKTRPPPDLTVAPGTWLLRVGWRKARDGHRYP